MDKKLHLLQIIARVCGVLAGISTLILVLLALQARPIVVLLLSCGLSGAALLVMFRTRDRVKGASLCFSSEKVADAASSLPQLLSASCALAAEERRKPLGKVISGVLDDFTAAESEEILSEICLYLDRELRIELDNSLCDEGWGISYASCEDNRHSICRFRRRSGGTLLIHSSWFRGEEWGNHVGRLYARYPYKKMVLASDMKELVDSHANSTKHATSPNGRVTGL